MSGISFSGLGSGLPVDEIVKASVEARAQPLQKMQEERSLVQEQISTYGKLTSRISDLQSAMADLKGEDKYNLLSAESGDESLFTAEADPLADATEGDYSVEVMSEAKNYRWVSEEVDLSDDTQDLSMTINGTAVDPGNNATLDDLRSAINEDEDLDGVTANIVNTGDGNGRLTINAEETGDANALTISSPGDLTQDAGLSIENDLDAEIKVDGIAATSSSNTFENVITGVTLDVTPGALKDSGGSETASLEVKRDDEQILENVNGFKEAYNDVVRYLNELKGTTQNEDGQQLESPLARDNTIQTIEQSLRSVLDTPAGDGSENFENYLTYLGFSTHVETGSGSEDSLETGTLKLDESEFKARMDEDMDQVVKVIGDEDNGFAARMEETAKLVTSGGIIDGEVVEGTIATRTSGLNDKADRLENRMEDTLDRLDSYEQRLYDQFNAVESTTASLQAQGQQVQSQLGGGGGLASLL